jgi:hypothetical protein
MKKAVSILVLIIFFISIFNSCKKNCESENLGTFKFTSTDLQIIPYQGTDSLIFSDSLGNSITYNGIGRGSVEDYHDQYPNLNNDPNFCIGNYFYTENNDVAFGVNGKDYHFGINLSLSMDSGSPFGQNIKKIFGFDISYKDTKDWYFGITLNIDGLRLSGNNISYKDSLKIGPNKFFSVYVMTQNNDNLKTVFYTISQGVVGFRTNNGHTWYLSYEKLK